MDIARIVVSGVTSGVGKTTVAVAIMHALRQKKGLEVQPFKVGPDFIDPSYHTFVTGRESRNLDVWMMGRRGVQNCFASACEGADIAVIEGVMGLFDGMSGKDNFASTAHVAKILDAPVILVVDASKSARSIAAIVLGFLHFDKKIRISGIVLNNVAGARHAGYIVEAFADKIKAPILAIIERNGEIKMEERHLGLIPAQELHQSKKEAILKAANYISDKIDLDKLLSFCNTGHSPYIGASHRASANKTRIAVALDESFNFYYADNLDALERFGAELVFFSPVKELVLPENIHGIILGGGYPEILADKLEKNKSMIRSLKKAVKGGMPVYGECGGLMYLTQSIRGYKGDERTHKMVGLIDADTLMTNKLTLSYTEAECNSSIFGKANLRGHEFHYSKIENIASDSRFAYLMKKGNGIIDSKDGFIINDNGLAAYMHLHFSNRTLPYRMVQACIRYSRR
ncbi:MAG TPA: cobyrinate a,c-diamide synthase [Nitrososphaera sp.]|nr:cobyrinate a,c-diamide synthase [Nitrososphaera sp.]